MNSSNTTLCLLILFLTAFTATVTLSPLQLPSDRISSIHNSINLTTHILHKWPPLHTDLNIDGDLHMQIHVYGFDEDLSFEPILVEALEMITLDIETEGDQNLDSRLSEKAYRWDEVLLIMGNLSVKAPPTWLTRRQASKIVDFLTGLTYLYGPQELNSFLVQERSTGKLQFCALHFILRDRLDRVED